MQLSTLLPRGPQDPGAARLLLSDRFNSELTATALAELSLLVSELVTNAVRHGEGAICLRVHVAEELVRGEVIDDGPGFEAAVRERGPQEVAGRGLMIVATLAQRWGVHDGSSHVWFELQRSGGGAQPSPPHLGVEQRPEPLD